MASTTETEPVARLLALLDDGAPSPDASAGFVDLLGGPSAPPTLARRLMESTAVPLVYTRYWRPALGRAAKGLRVFDAPEAALASFRALLRPGGRLALLTSARRGGPLGVGDAALGRLSGMRMFDRSEVVDRLRELGFEGLTLQVSGLAQFVGGRLPGATPPEPASTGSTVGPRTS